MPEAGRHAPVLIAISFQALNRIEREGQKTRLCNCTVVILFAGFFVEANLNHIFERLGLESQMETFGRGERKSGERKRKKYYPGLQDKLSFFHNKFVAHSEAGSLQEFRANGGNAKIRRRFKGFAELYGFRNDLSHGVINSSANSVEETKRLRQQAKNIVGDLYTILKKRGHDVPRDTTYHEAIQHHSGR